LISRRRALIVALDLIDREGLDAMRMRRLGDELGVNGASLYHPFQQQGRDRRGAAELALNYVRTPDTRNEDWPVWMLRNTRGVRDALLQHPHLIPVVLGRAPLGIGTAMLESSAALLLIAPPAMLHVWTMPGLEPDRPYTAGPARTGDLDEAVRTQLAQLGYTSTLAASTDQDFRAALTLGTRVFAEDEYVAVTEEKQTHLGPGFFLTNRTTYSSADGASVGLLTTAVFHFAPRPAASVAPPLAPPTAPPQRPAAAAPVRLGPDARCGPVVVPVTPTQIIAGALATRDFYPVHHDRDFARRHGNADFLMNSLTTNGLLARIVGEWSGQAPLCRLATRIVAPAYVHDELTVTARVTGFGPDWADLTVRAAPHSGVHAEAVARVARVR
jgi:acyl dehydratase